MGVNIDRVNWIVCVEPLCRLHDILQAFGRSGRICSDGLKRAVCFTLWEGELTEYLLQN
jgi:hypothetical protein